MQRVKMRIMSVLFTWVEVFFDKCVFPLGVKYKYSDNSGVQQSKENTITKQQKIRVVISGWRSQSLFLVKTAPSTSCQETSVSTYQHRDSKKSTAWATSRRSSLWSHSGKTGIGASLLGRSHRQILLWIFGLYL